MPKWAWWIPGIAAALAALNALGNPFVLDDLTKIVENLDIRSLANIPDKLVYPYHAYQVLQRNDPSRPLVYLFYTLIYAVQGLRPYLFHVCSVVFHGLNAGLVFWFGRKLQEKYFADRDDYWIPLLGATLFALAPIQMGSVIYAYALSDILSSFFMLSALWLEARGPKPSARARFGVLACFVCALGCKQSAVVLPVLVMLWDYFVRGRVRRNYGLWLTTAFYFVLRFAYFGGVGDLESYAQAWPRLDYALCEPWIVWNYVAKTLVPYHLAIDHFLRPMDIDDGVRIIGLALWVAVVGAALWLYRRRRTPMACVGLWALLWYWVCLAPTSSFMPTTDLLVERRVYLANVAFFLALAFALRNRPRVKPALALYAMAFFGLSVARNVSFASPEAVWRETLEIYPTNQRALNSLAKILGDKNDFKGATETFETVIRLAPNDYTALGNYGTLIARDDNPGRDIPRAIEMFERSRAANPTIAENYYNIGRLLHLQGRLNEAKNYYLKTLELKPNMVPAMNNLAAVDIDQHNLSEAETLLDRALRLDPSYAPAQVNKARISGSR